MLQTLKALILIHNAQRILVVIDGLFKCLSGEYETINDTTIKTGATTFRGSEFDSQSYCKISAKSPDFLILVRWIFFEYDT